MALLTATGSFPYPHYNSPSRDFYSGYQLRETVATIAVLGTITATKNFVLTGLNVGITTLKAASVVTIKCKNVTLATLPGTAINNWQFDYFPSGLAFGAADTNTVEMIISGATCAAYCLASGYFD